MTHGFESTEDFLLTVIKKRFSDKTVTSDSLYFTTLHVYTYLIITCKLWNSKVYPLSIKPQSIRFLSAHTHTQRHYYTHYNCDASTRVEYSCFSKRKNKPRNGYKREICHLKSFSEILTILGLKNICGKKSIRPCWSRNMQSSRVNKRLKALGKPAVND